MSSRSWALSLLFSSLFCTQAQAVLQVRVFETGGNVRLEYGGSLDMSNMTTSTSSDLLEEHRIRRVTPSGGPPGQDYTAIINVTALSASSVRVYSNPFLSSSGPFVSLSTSATSFGGDEIYLPTASLAQNATLRFDANEFSGNVWSGSGFLQWNKATIASLGISQPSSGWVLTNGQRITISVEPTPVPGPLPLLGAAAAFAWSRKLRRRIQAAAPAAA